MNLNISHEGFNNSNEEAKKRLEIINGFEFYDDNNDFIESLKKQFENLNTNNSDLALDGLEKLAFVNLEIKTGGKGRQEFAGVDIAQNLEREDNLKKVLMYAFSNLDTIKKSKEKINLLLAKENFKFLRLPFTAEDALKVLKESSETKISEQELKNIQDRETNSKVAMLLHYISQVHSVNNLDNANPEQLNKTVTEAKEYFPALNDKTDKEVVEFLFSIRENVNEVMKGQHIEGVYCDIEGTLFNGEELNTKTLNMLKEYETQGKEITLWTDGDTKKIQSLLDREGIAFLLKSKIDFAGASAEIVIDNDDKNTFSAKTKIFPTTFVKV